MIDKLDDTMMIKKYVLSVREWAVNTDGEKVSLVPSWVGTLTRSLRSTRCCVLPFQRTLWYCLRQFYELNALVVGARVGAAQTQHRCLRYHRSSFEV